nr:carbon catabolite-derepressing protein kinase [Quercus suber]
MTSALDDEDLSLSIPAPHGRRPSKESEYPNGSNTNPASHAGDARAPASSNPSNPASGKPAARLGQYNIVKTLGEGSFGKVKLAIHQSSKQKVALKIIARRKLITRDMAGRIEREIQYLQLLRHPHIIKLFTVITTPGEIIMVLEYAGGELFDYIVQNGKMTEVKARKFFQQIVCAVEYCHRHKIVHRDLKPENLLLDEQLNVKIADFGLSNIMTDGNFLKTSCGSPNYAAPEVISGKLYAGPEVDVWSCGVILYVLLVGRLPFDDEYIPALFKKIASGTFYVPNYLSSGAVRLIKKMLQVNPVNRITVPEIRQDPWFMEDLAEYLQPPVEDFIDTGVDPAKAIDPHALARGKPVAVREKLHNSVVGKLGKTMGYAARDVQEALAKDEPSAIKDAYLIVRENTLMMTNPSLAADQPEFMAQSPPAFHTNFKGSPRAANGGNARPAPSPMSAMNVPSQRQPSTSSASNVAEARSPASTIGILPSSLPDYHAAYMHGHINKSHSPTNDEAAESEKRPRTKEEQEATARRLKPHSKSSLSLHRTADKPEPMTSMPDKVSKKPKPTKWQFGIRSRNTPTEAMLAIYKALQKMGAEWEVARPKEVGAESGEASPNRNRAGSQSPEYSDSDPDAGTDPEYASHSDQERRRRKRSEQQRGIGGGKDSRGRARFGRWNDYGYTLPEDPWVINARFKKEGLFPPGLNQPSSTHSSRVDLNSDAPRKRSSTQSSGTTSHENMAAAGPASALQPNARSEGASPDAAVWVYVTIQLYCIEKDFFLVDFKCAGYERLVRRFAREMNGDSETDVVAVDNAGESFEDGDVTENARGDQLVGVGRWGEEKDITSPFPFLDVASRLIIQLAEAND